ncbi:hypothetical protein PLESTF_000599600 [Pleodorina starrii]|nr:hypothetical protein PLESTF_000599600 [Pleodorina starrii]
MAQQQQQQHQLHQQHQLQQQQPLVNDAGRGFDLSLAVPLAATAFAAYNHPIDKQQFLLENFFGLLDVKIHRAAKLRKSDMFGATPPDAFAVLSAEWPSLCARTRARRFTSVAKSTDPVWDPGASPLNIPIRDPASDTVRVQLYDEDIGWDEQLGSADLRLGDLVGRPEQHLTLELSGPGVNKAATSTVTLSCRLRSFAQCSAGDLDSVSLVDTVPPTEQPGEKLAGGILHVFRPLGAVSKNVPPPKPACSWDDVVRAMGGGGGADDLSPVMFLECWDTDTQVWMFRNVAKRSLVIAFRGTEKVRDWLTNFQFAGEKPYDLVAKRPKTAPGGAEVLVHSGFLSAYKSVRKASNALIRTLTGGFAQPPDRAWRLLVTGHSLGGALATLAAYDLAVQRWEYEQEAKRPSHVALELYSWGCPRVGNKAFAEDFRALLPSAWRFTNRLDVVTSLPPWDSFFHIGTAVQLDPQQNRLLFDPPEVGLWDKLRSGSGLAAHVDGSYLDTMLRVVQTAARTTAGASEPASASAPAPAPAPASVM